MNSAAGGPGHKVSLSRVAAIATQATAASPLQPVATDFGYLPYGPATGWQHGNGLATRIGYDQDYRITDIDVADLDTIMSLTYQYNDVSNITRMLDNLGSNSQQFDYDALNRLTSASGTYGEIDYTYDGVGNRLSRTIDRNGETITENYDYKPGSHRLERVTATDDTGTDTRQFAHDANGNIISDNSAERQLDIAVNARNRMAAVYKDGERVGEYEYNALGQRVAKTSRYRGRLHAHFDQGWDSVVPSAAGEPRSGNTNGQSQGKSNSKKDQSDGPSTGTAENTNGLHSHYDNKPVTERLHFHYDQTGNLIAESDDKGNVIREYIYLGNYRVAMAATSLDRPSVDPVDSVLLGTRNTVILSASEGSRGRNNSLALYFIHNDHLGTPIKVTDAGQRIVWSMAQTPFGEASLTTEAIVMPMRFPGQYADIESGFSYNYFRDYDATLGRYVQSDPIGLSGGINTYSYALINPTNKFDQSGRCPNCLTAVVGGILGTLGGIYGTYLENPDAGVEEYILNASVGLLTGTLAGAGLVQAGPIAGALVGFFANILTQFADIASHRCKNFRSDFNIGSVIGSAVGGGLAGTLGLAGNGIVPALALGPKATLLSVAATVTGAKIGE